MATLRATGACSSFGLHNKIIRIVLAHHFQCNRKRYFARNLHHRTRKHAQDALGNPHDCPRHLWRNARVLLLPIFYRTETESVMDGVRVTAPKPLSFQHEIDFGVNDGRVLVLTLAIVNGFCPQSFVLLQGSRGYCQTIRKERQGTRGRSSECFLPSTRRTNPLNSCIKWDQRLLTFDPVALHHVTKNSNIYEKPWTTQRFITSFIGCGLLSAAGSVHKRQRRVATPAFSIQNLRAFAPIVFERGFRLRDRWRDIISKESGDEAVLDVCMWASRITFDVIGAAGSCATPLPGRSTLIALQASTTTSTRSRMTQTSSSAHTGRCLSSRSRKTKT
jgi:hypothetical protein